MSDRVLIVDDDVDMCRLIADALHTRQIDTEWVTSGDEGFDALLERDFDVVLTDLNMPGLGGIELCRRVAENVPDLPVVVMTAFGSLETAVAAIRAGAYDFVTKPVELEVLALTLERAIERRGLTERVKRLSSELERGRGFGELLGRSSAMRHLYDILNRLADSEASVLVTGESGTGKELVARGLHERSPRRDGPFVPVNCSAFPDNLLESELFGHARGAFTDAKSARRGLFRQADRGTLFLDEVGDLPIALQPKLLRALEERRVRPVGSDEEVRFDARIIAATNHDLEAAAEEGRFRPDLLYRIAVVQVEVPPLRARGTDVLLLAQHFLEVLSSEAGRAISELAPATAERLMRYSWPGNVRELRNAIERGVALARFEHIAVDDLPAVIRDYEPSSLVIGGTDPRELVSLDEIERRYMSHVLEALGGNRTAAARVLGIDRKTLYRRMKESAGEVETD